MSDSVRIVLGRLEVRSKRTRLAQARKAAGHTQEGLAEAMGVERSTVTRWEAGATEPLPYQRARLAGLLGRSLVQLEELLRNEAHDDQLSRSSPVVVVDDTSYSGSLGTRSRARTHALLSALPESDSARPRYLPPNDIIEQCSELVGSSSVQMVTGPVGSGKTLMVYHLATVLADRADFQLHSCESWGAVGFDLAAEVLRYASLPAEGDALLALERAGRTLNRPCVVVVDGVNTRFHFDEVCRQVDAAARQMIQGRLKFLLVVRTPPDADVSGYPVLAAAARWDRSRPSSGSSQLEYWDLAVARRAWDGSRLACEPRFADLPVTVQRLVQIPVYMRLVMSAGLTTSRGGINPYRLVEHCVRSVLPGPESAADARLDELAESAEAGAPEPLPTLQHDLVHEYLLAKRLAQRMVDRGRSAATVIELNELAARAAESAADRGVFDFVVHALEDTDPELAAAVAVSPSIDADITLPFMLAVSSGAEFVNEHVLRSCAHRCRQEPILTLARALLATTGLRAALGANYPFWLIDLLRQSGPAIWPDLVEHLETTLDTGTARDVLNEVDLDNADEAVFTARYFFLIVTGDRFAPSIELLLGHAEWRVRAALAAGLTDSRAPRNPSTRGILDRLVADYDYKVRAAAADAIGRMDAEAAERHLATLLTDENWHVRGRVLHGLMAGAQTSPAANALADLAARIIASNPSWHTPPAHIARSMHRFLLMHGVPRPPDEANDDARRRALLGLLREVRTGWIDLETTTRLLLLTEAKESPDWLLQREERSATQSPTAPPICPRRTSVPTGCGPRRRIGVSAVGDRCRSHLTCTISIRLRQWPLRSPLPAQT